MPTRLTVRTAPRSRRSQAPSPRPDQRVFRLLSTALPATLVSLVLAVTAEAAGVISTYVCAVAVAWASIETPATRSQTVFIFFIRRDSPSEHARLWIPDPRGARLRQAFRRSADVDGTVTGYDIIPQPRHHSFG